MTPEQLAAWRQLADATTPGPWEAMEFAQGYGFVTPTDNGKLRVIFHTDEIAVADAAFIAAAREAVPALLAEVERLQAIVAASTVKIRELENRLYKPHRYEEQPDHYVDENGVLVLKNCTISGVIKWPTLGFEAVPNENGTVSIRKIATQP